MRRLAYMVNVVPTSCIVPGRNIAPILPEAENQLTYQTMYHQRHKRAILHCRQPTSFGSNCFPTWQVSKCKGKLASWLNVAVDSISPSEPITPPVFPISKGKAHLNRCSTVQLKP